MNYRHLYHAGNFADVLKHIVLTRLIEHQKRKDKAFRVIDTHAGTGLYDLGSAEAQKTGEWRSGIGRLLKADLPADAAAIAAPYLDVVRSLNTEGLRFYPGSPLIVRRLMRRQDRLTAIELHPEDTAWLKEEFADDFQTRVIALDGWLAFGAQLPPKEKRGIVLTDPPFEEEGEFGRMVEALLKAHRRWPGGTYAFWYPLKDHPAVTAFREALAGTGIPKILDISLTIRGLSPEPRLDGCGMAIVNPPYTLAEEMRVLLPVLTSILAQGAGAGWSVTPLSE